MFPRVFASLFLVVHFAAAAEPPAPRFRTVELDAKVQIGYGVAVADVDGDKLPDILLADKRQFRWYRNPGPEKCGDAAAWPSFVIAENLTEQDNVCLAAQDIDGDGKCELAVGAGWNPSDTVGSGAVFYLIPPADRTQRWEPVRLHAEPTTHRMRWIKLESPGAAVPGEAVAAVSDRPGEAKAGTKPAAVSPAEGDRRPPLQGAEWGLVVVPLHGRENKNGEGAPVKVLLYHPPTEWNDAKGEWKTEVIDESMHMTHNFDVERFSEFPIDHLLIAGREGLYYLPGTRSKNRAWIIQSGDKNQGFVGAGEVRWGASRPTSEMPKLFIATIEPMHGNQLAWYVNWSADGMWFYRRVLTDQLTEGHALACGDLLGTGADQIVVGWRGSAQKPRPVGIKLFTALDAQGEQWREDFVDDNGMACEDLVLADLNGDGKLDVVASGRSTHNLRVYFNETDARKPEAP